MAAEVLGPGRSAWSVSLTDNMLLFVDETLTSPPSDFPVSRFKGKKYLILSTVVWCGGSSLFLGIAYMVSGAVVMLAGFIITAIHLKLKKRKTYFQR